MTRSALSPLRKAWLHSLVARRDLLKVGPLALSANVWPSLLSPAQANVAPNPSAKAKSIIYLWLGGGCTHLETFDPKPEAPEGIRGTLGAIPTTLPGVFFNEACPNLARIAHDLAVVRSFP